MLQRCPPRVPNEKIYVMLRIAIQNKGRLNEQSVALLREIGINVDEAKRKFLSKASNFPIEVLYLRDDDIPQVVANGTASLGIVGLNEVAERGFDVEVVARLGFGGCRISLAIPKGDEYVGVEYFRGKRIATSYPSILRRYLEQQGVDAELEVITGSVEIAPGIRLADAIFDIVSSGSTLVSNRLKEVETVVESEAVLIGTDSISPEKRGILDELLFRFDSVQAADDKKYILMNVPQKKLNDVLSVLPGIKSPTVMPLADKEWCSVHTVLDEKCFWEIINRLKMAGAEGILVLDIEKMIL